MSDGPTSERPNVLVVMTDQQRWDTLGAYGCPMELTPTLDELAASGTTIEQAITPQPLCGPYRAAFQTGKFASETGVWRESKPLEDERTIGHMMSAAGYDVGYIGNWHVAGTFDESVPDDRRGGYEDFWIAADIPEFTTQPYEGHLYDGFNESVEFDQYRADAFTDYAIEAMDDLSEPFFLVVSYVEPHQQNDMWTFVAPDGYADDYDTNPYVPRDLQDRPGDWYSELPDYYGMVKRLDESVDRLFQYLTDQDINEETLFVYTSDHGCHFRTRPGEYKRTAHEAAVRVPTILYGPGFDDGTNIQDVTSTIDLPPTILDVAGVDVPGDMHGRSLLGTDQSPTDNEGVFIQVSESQIGRALRTDRWKYVVAAPSPTGWRGGQGEKTSDVYVERYLYDLRRDPAEQVNLAGRPDYADISKTLRERLLKRIEAVEGYEPDIKPCEKGYPEF